ncbi:hypothetical protein TrLO_g7159 [Triparma laevis f. longispina]|uniref:Protein kinase domain-containing protein n=1 Tax=Triparma laevis f. longispina TaxID=1714387 RepID=A0A9W7FM88_9STRA|nr:hypothetical protein TrLO_g7159 [Triparma laevis f. longispina]
MGTSSSTQKTAAPEVSDGPDASMTSHSNMIRLISNLEEKQRNEEALTRAYYSPTSNKRRLSFHGSLSPPPELSNVVNSDDFTYHEILGCGGFGFVVKVIKKSTGASYAMKIQNKVSLLTTAKDLETKKPCQLLVHTERSCMAEASGHPFLTSLQYAFCTQSSSCLVMDLASAGNLHDLLDDFKLDTSNNNRGIPEEIVKQCVAEISVALNFLHSRGVLYRDLKLSNVLLCGDGHLRLCDFGLAGRLEEEISVSEHSLDEHSSHSSSPPPMLRPEPKKFQDNDDEEEPEDLVSSSVSDDSTKHTYSEFQLPDGELLPPNLVPSPNRRKLRCRTSCGTVGYRGPEVIRERNLAYGQRTGYGQSSDYFTLGVTTYILLTGKKPFPQRRDFTPNQQVNYVPYSMVTEAEGVFRPIQSPDPAKNSRNSNFEFAALMNRIPYPSYVSEDAKSLCEGLMNRAPEKRLDFSALAEHPFLASSNYSWDAEDMKAAKAHPRILKYIKARFPQALFDQARWNLKRKASKIKLVEAEKPSFEHKSLEDLVHNICAHIINTEFPDVAAKKCNAWTAKIHPDVDKYFENWSYVGTDALKLERIAARYNGWI